MLEQGRDPLQFSLVATGARFVAVDWPAGLGARRRQDRLRLLIGVSDDVSGFLLRLVKALLGLGLEQLRLLQDRGRVVESGPGGHALGSRLGSGDDLLRLVLGFLEQLRFRFRGCEEGGLDDGIRVAIALDALLEGSDLGLGDRELVLEGLDGADEVPQVPVDGGGFVAALDGLERGDR